MLCPIYFINTHARDLHWKTKEIQNSFFKEYCFEGGIIEYVSELNNGKDIIGQDIIYTEGSSRGDDGDVLVEVAMQYNTGFQSNVVSYVNNISTIEGGTHEQGFQDSLTRIFNTYAGENKLFKNESEKLSRNDVQEGLTAIISIKHIYFPWEYVLCCGRRYSFFSICSKNQ